MVSKETVMMMRGTKAVEIARLPNRGALRAEVVEVGVAVVAAVAVAMTMVSPEVGVVMVTVGAAMVEVMKVEDVARVAVVGMAVGWVVLRVAEMRGAVGK